MASKVLDALLAALPLAKKYLHWMPKFVYVTGKKQVVFGMQIPFTWM